MDVEKRMQLVRMIDKLEENCRFSKKIGTYNVSVFKTSAAKDKIG